MADLSLRLAQLPVFRGLEPGALPELLSLASRARVREGEWCFLQGQPASALFVLLEGRVRVTQVGAGGQQVVLHLVGPGEAFGCSAILRERQYPGSAEVVAAGLVARFDAPALRQIDARWPVVTRNALALVASRVRDLRERYREAVTERVEPRIAHALLRLVAEASVPDGNGGRRIGLRLSRQDLAELAGTTMYTVSRTLTAWEANGWVAIGRERVTVRDAQALAGLIAPLDAAS